MTAVQEVGPLRAVVDRVKDQTQDLLDCLVQWGRDSERPQLSVGLGNVDPSGRLELKAFVSEARDQVRDDLGREPVKGLPITSRRHVARFGLDPLVRYLVQLRSVEETVEVKVHPTSIRIVPA